MSAANLRARGLANTLPPVDGASGCGVGAGARGGATGAGAGRAGAGVDGASGVAGAAGGGDTAGAEKSLNAARSSLFSAITHSNYIK